MCMLRVRMAHPVPHRPRRRARPTCPLMNTGQSGVFVNAARARRLATAAGCGYTPRRQRRRAGPVAQWLEQATHNRLVGGSNPSGPIFAPHSIVPPRFSLQIDDSWNGGTSLRGISAVCCAVFCAACPTPATASRWLSRVCKIVLPSDQRAMAGRHAISRGSVRVG